VLYGLYNAQRFLAVKGCLACSEHDVPILSQCNQIILTKPIRLRVDRCSLQCMHAGSPPLKLCTGAITPHYATVF